MSADRGAAQLQTSGAIGAREGRTGLGRGARGSGGAHGAREGCS